jgi:hypothetical protein
MQCLPISTGGWLASRMGCFQFLIQYLRAYHVFRAVQMRTILKAALRICFSGVQAQTHGSQKSPKRELRRRRMGIIQQ